MSQLYLFYLNQLIGDYMGKQFMIMSALAVVVLLFIFYLVYRKIRKP